jgi:hypothetical protein
MAVLSARRFALDTRIVTVTLALVLAVVSMPMACGWVVADTRSAIAMDICHPTQSLDVSSAPLLVPAPRLDSINYVFDGAVLKIDEAYRGIAGRLGEAPDSPPPETLT